MIKYIFMPSDTDFSIRNKIIFLHTYFLLEMFARPIEDFGGKVRRVAKK